MTATAPATSPAVPAPSVTATDNIVIPWQGAVGALLQAASSPAATTFAFLYQLYAPGLAQVFETPKDVHDLVIAEFGKLETVVSRGGALTVPVHAGVVANVLKAAIAQGPAFVNWAIKEADPWITEELQAYGILPKA